MSERVRLRLFAVAIAGLLGLMLWGFAGLPDFGDYRGPYGDILNRVAVPERSTTDVVTAVNFDYRGFDTLGEEFILFAAVIGVASILRTLLGERTRRPDDDAAGRHVPETSLTVRVTGLGLVAPDHPGGDLHRRPRPPDPRRRLPGWRDPRHGAAAHLPVGRLHDVSGGGPDVADRAGGGNGRRRLRPDRPGRIDRRAAPSSKTVLGKGTPGELLSAGTIPLSNVAVGLAVTGGFVFMLSEFLSSRRAATPRSAERMSFLPYAVAAWVMGDRPVRHRHQPRPRAPRDLPVGHAVLVVPAAAGDRLLDGAQAPVFADIPLGTRAVDPVVQALTLTDVVVGTTVTALLLALSVQAHKRYGTLDPRELRPERGRDHG